MKFRSSAISEKPISISEAIVVCDPYHRATVGLDAISDHCAFVDDIEAAEQLTKIHASPTTTLVDTRPEEIDKFLICFSPRAQEDTNLRLGFLFPRWNFELIDYLLYSPHTETLSLIDLRIDNRYVQLTLADADAKDGHAITFFQGFALATSLKPSGHEKNQQLGEMQNLRWRLVTALQAFDLLDKNLCEAENRTADAEDAVDTEDTTIPQEAALENSERTRLENRIVTLTGQLDALQRKYDILAGSKLGSITLRTWERKRGNHQP